MSGQIYCVSYLKMMLCWCASLIFLVGHATAQDAELEFEQQIEKITKSASRSIVGLEFIGGSGRVEGAKKSRGPGTGVVVGEAGWVLTAAYHVADNPTSIVATLPSGKRAPAEIVAKDHARNIVLLKITTDETLVVPETINRGQLKVGQTVVALGKGFDVNSVQVSTGILSATNRVWGKAIQTDAKIGPANYGGPLLNLEGQVVGILAPLSPRGEKIMNGSEWYDSGIGFAVPLDELKKRLPELQQGKDLFAGKLGVAFRGTDIYVDDCEVAFCTGTSPAGQAGLRPGDKIVAADGNQTPRQAAFRHAIGPAYAGDTFRMTINRNGKTEKVEAVLVSELPPYVPVGIGVALVPIEPTKEPDSTPLQIRRVQVGSSAASAGIETGDRIVSVNGIEVKKVTDLTAQIAATANGENIDLAVERDGQPKDFTLAVESRGTNIPDLSELVQGENGEAKSFELKVAEAPNSCFVIAPKKSETSSSLLVWLPAPGDFDAKSLEADWREACESNHVTLLAVGSADEKKWTPDEQAVVLRAIATLNRSEEFDRRRVVIGGQAAGGTMASLVCFGQPRLFQGLVLDSAPASNQLPEITTSPVAPMMVLASNFENQDSIDASLQPIRASKTPVETTPTVSPESILRWVNFVDRL